MPTKTARLLRTLSIRGSPSPSQSHKVIPSADLIAAAMCILLKLICHWIKYFLLFHHPGRLSFIALLVISETAAHAVPVAWCEVNLCLEAAVLESALDKLESGASGEVIATAKKANRKSASLPGIFQTSLDIFIDQQITSFLAFYRAGCNGFVAFSISAVMLALPLVLQQRSKDRISSVASSRRCKENDLRKENQTYLLSSYAESLRSLARGDFLRRLCIILTFGFIIVFTGSEDLQYLAAIIPRILHTDEKVAKLWKALVDTKSAWALLREPSSQQSSNAPSTFDEYSLHASRIHLPSSGSPIASREARVLSQIMKGPSSVGRKFNHFVRVWVRGSQYKSYAMGYLSASYNQGKAQNVLNKTDVDVEGGGVYGTMLAGTGVAC